MNEHLALVAKRPNECVEDHRLTEYIFGGVVRSLLVSRDLLNLVRDQAAEEIVFPPERWAATFRSHSQLILHELREFLGYSLPLHNRGQSLS